MLHQHLFRCASESRGAATAFAIAAESPYAQYFCIKHGSSASKMTRQMLQSQLMAML